MSSLPFVDTAQDAAESVREKTRGKLLDWLPRHYCDCGEPCEATTEYVESQAMVMPIYRCPECGKRYYREEDNPVSADMWG